MAFWKKNETDTVAATPSPATRSATPEPLTKSFAENVVAPAPVIRPSLDRDTTVTGKLSFNSPTRIDGKLHGEVRANDLLIVGEDAFVEGIVRAEKLVVLGEVRGEVHVKDRVEIGITGRVFGAIEAKNLVVLEGGHVDADCRVGQKKKEEVLEVKQNA